MTKGAAYEWPPSIDTPVGEHSTSLFLNLKRRTTIMPTIKLTVPQGAWTKDEKAEIVTRLTDALNSVAVESKKGDIKPYINTHIHETSEGGYAMGGTVVG